MYCMYLLDMRLSYSLLHSSTFAQVMGCKLVWLFPSDQTAFLYPHEGLLCNTSQVGVQCTHST